MTPALTSAVISRSGATARASAAASTAEHPEVDGSDSERPALVEAGQQEEIVDERCHADRFLLGAAHGLVELVVGTQAAVAVQLGVSPNGGDRGAQLVRGIGDEAAQARLRCRPLVERVLDRASSSR